MMTKTYAKYATIIIEVSAPKERIDGDELALSEELYDIQEKLDRYLVSEKKYMDFEFEQCESV